jgi:hypothetical protein
MSVRRQGARGSDIVSGRSTSTHLPRRTYRKDHCSRFLPTRLRSSTAGQPRIDKSVLRRNIGRRECIGPGQPTVDYIRERFEVAWVVTPQSKIAMLERGLIARLAAEWDLYNLSGNRAK